MLLALRPISQFISDHLTAQHAVAQVGVSGLVIICRLHT